MTDDLVKRLLDIASPLADEAAGTIHRLTAERDALTADNARLRAALTVYADPCDEIGSSDCRFEGNMCCRTARAALNTGKEPSQ